MFAWDNGTSRRANGWAGDNIARTMGPIQVTLDGNGIGLPLDVDVAAVQSLGWQLVPMLVEQLTGTFELERSTGTTAKLTFSELNYKGRI